MIEDLGARSTMGDHPIAFQQLLRARVDTAVTWLLRSIDACNGRGSAAFYSRLVHPTNGWHAPYPETTGYIIPTLLRYAHVIGDSQVRAIALDQARWIMNLQAPDGSLPGGFHRPGGPHEPSVFNTGQMILGLVAAYDETSEREFLEAATRAATWLADEVDDRAGTWISHSYVSGFSPAYYTRVCWPMLEVSERTESIRIRQAATRILDTIASRQRPNGVVEGWGFRPDRPAFTHTIAYTIRGFIESARILGNDGGHLFEAALAAAEPIRRRFDMRGKLAGTFDDDLKGDYRYVCVTGNCQFAIIWLALSRLTRDPRYVNSALRVLDDALGSQRVNTLDPGVRGAIPGSSPRWGRYLTMRYPNWATKFFVDAALLADAHLDGITEEGPCAWR